MIKQIDCEKCGRAVKFECPETAPAGLRAWWKNINTTVCADCEAKAEQDWAREERRRAYLQRLEASQIPAKYAMVRWPQLDRNGCAGAIDSARQWAAGEIRGLMLTGAFGVGKSTVAAAAVTQMLVRRQVRWVSVMSMAVKLPLAFSDRDRRDVLKALAGAGALVLDDLDKIVGNEHGVMPLLAAVDKRISDGDPLLVTTNLSIGEIAQKFPHPHGEALASRLAGYCRVHELKGADRRLVAA